MTEAERRAAFEAAVVEALEAIAETLHPDHFFARGAVNNVRALHEAAVDAAPEPQGAERAL